MKYKLSFFNEIIELDNQKYIWNTFSGALVKLDCEGEQYITSFNGKKDGSDYYQVLLKNKFIVPEAIDEVGSILINEERSIFDSKPEMVIFTIAPGMNCNYHCSYCFEKERSREQHMSKDTEIDVVSFIKKRIDQTPSIKKVNIKWFGGEPLLYLNTIKNITEKVYTYCRSKDIDYDSGIITNGSLLTEEVLDTVIKCHITSAQITIDGTETEYCHSKGTLPRYYHQTIENISNACDRIKITIRLNILGNEADKAIEITDYLLSEKALVNKIDVYFAFVRDYDKDSVDLDYIHYTEEYVKWLHHMFLHYNWKETHRNAIRTKTTSCGLIRLHNNCIGPNGELYKCEHCIGNISQSCGDVVNGNYHNYYERAYMETLSSGKRTECIQCKYLPLCMGGCANDNVTNERGFNCDAFKQFEKRLKLMYSGIIS